MEELKKCPFCGGKAEILIPIVGDFNDWWLAGCNPCDIWFDGDTEEKAIQAWNRRCEDD